MSDESDEEFLVMVRDWSANCQCNASCTVCRLLKILDETDEALLETEAALDEFEYQLDSGRLIYNPDD